MRRSAASAPTWGLCRSEQTSELKLPTYKARPVVFVGRWSKTPTFVCQAHRPMASPPAHRRNVGLCECRPTLQGCECVGRRLQPRQVPAPKPRKSELKLPTYKARPVVFVGQWSKTPTFVCQAHRPMASTPAHRRNVGLCECRPTLQGCEFVGLRLQPRQVPAPKAQMSALLQPTYNTLKDSRRHTSVSKKSIQLHAPDSTHRHSKDLTISVL
jgi:hypothetical protein